MSWPEKERWMACWRSIGGVGDSEEWHARLLRAYGEAHRHYHNGQHIAACLSEFEGVRHLTRQPAAVEFALWFHDAVYDPRASDNEERSADMAESCLGHAQISPAFIESVRQLIMATKSHEVDAGSDAAVMVDVDLSILGQEQKRFDEYEKQIRDEYAWVPETVFALKRAEILQRFLARETIFATEWFRNKYERQARRNLETSILTLKQRGSERS